MSPDLLASVRYAARAKESATQRYRAAVLAAAASGHSHADIARAAGCRRQSVREFLQRVTQGTTPNGKETP